jgi:hypothetical protein
MTAKTALKFYALLTPFGVQEVCSPCLAERNVEPPVVEVNPHYDRCCDDCGAYRTAA